MEAKEAIIVMENFMELDAEDDPASVTAAWQTLKAAVLAQRSTNTGSPKLAALVDVAIRGIATGDSKQATINKLEYVRDQLRAGA